MYFFGDLSGSCCMLIIQSHRNGKLMQWVVVNTTNETIKYYCKGFTTMKNRCRDIRKMLLHDPFVDPCFIFANEI